MTFLEKIKLLVDKRYVSEFLKKHKDEYFCNKWWCHKIQISTLHLSEIKSSLKILDLIDPLYKQIEKEILEKGFDYNKSYIYVSNKKYIIDGHHRYFILKKHFEGTFLITVFVLTDMNSRYLYILKMSIVHLFVWLIRFLFKRNKGQIIELNL